MCEDSGGGSERTRRGGREEQGDGAAPMGERLDACCSLAGPWERDLVRGH